MDSVAAQPFLKLWEEGNEAVLPREPQLSQAVLVSPAQHQTEAPSEMTSSAAII